MSEIEPMNAPDEAAQEPPVSASSGSVDLSNRPDMAWLDEVEGEIDDVDLVLKCLARDSDSLCQTCTSAERDGVLAERPVLARCASTKQR